MPTYQNQKNTRTVLASNTSLHTETNMPESVQFSSLVNDLSQHAELDLSPDDNGAIALQFEDGILLQICDSGHGDFAMIADTGIDTTSLRPDVLPNLMELFLQINFATAITSRFSIGLSSEQTIVMTYSDCATRTTGFQLFELMESLLEQVRSLRQMIQDINTDTEPLPSEGPITALQLMGKFA